MNHHQGAVSTEPSIEFMQGSRKQSPQEVTIVTLFAEICERHADAIALTLGDWRMTYAELDRMSDGVARKLVERGAGRGSIVAVCLEPSFEMIAAMLGAIKCGAAYLPLDASYPAARLTETLEDAAPVAVLTARSRTGCFEGVPTAVLCVEEMDLQGAAPVVTEIGAQDPAYVIYTSGSTGRPKGVVVSHRNLVRLMTATEPWFRFCGKDVWTMFHSAAFDFSVWEIWGCLLHRGRLVLVPFAVSRSPEEFHALLVSERVTVLNQTPSAFVTLSQVDARLPAAPLCLRVVIFGGEALVPASLRGWIARHGDTRPELIHMYGITETTVHATYRRILAADAEHERESLIGVPIPDMQLHLLDKHKQPVHVGEEGELWVGGGGVALGYLNRPALGAERFVEADFLGLEGRLYRSGDLARRRPDGELVYLGRKDSQVKINGFRIELGEIEAAIVAHPSLVQACVIAHAESSGGARLAAYYVAKTGPEPTTRELSDFLAQRLPAQMMPAFYIGLPAFPLTANGKVNRQALPPPQPGASSSQRRSLTQASGLEYSIARIWRMVLGADEVGLDDNFFDVGGSSLLLIAVRTGLQEQLDRAIPVTWMFEYTTIRSLARKLGCSEDAGPLSAHPFAEAARGPREAFRRAQEGEGLAQG